MAMSVIIINNSFMLFLADYRTSKCFHTPEDTGRVPRCVSITEPYSICSVTVFKIGMGWSMLGAWIIFSEFQRLVVSVISCINTST